MQNYVEELAAEALKISTDAWAKAAAINLHFPKKPNDAAELTRALLHNTALQATFASITGYTPSKWLLKHELMEVRARRNALSLIPEPPAGDSSAEDPLQSASGMGLMGLCLSGGGIRSATFNLGVLQGLAELGLLRCFDYLASVSGGGYIHQFLAAWIHRDGFDEVNRKLIPQPEPGCPETQPEPIRWLRRYSNYLTPELGMLSGDTWVMVATWLRNTLLNQAILCTSLLALVLVIVNLPRIPHVFMGGPLTAVATGVFFALFIVGSSFAAENLMDFGSVLPEKRVLHKLRVQVTVAVPLLLAALVAAMLVPWLSGDFVLAKQALSFLSGVFLLFIFAACLTFGGGAHLCYLRSLRGVSGHESFGEFWRRKPKCRAHLKVVLAILGFVIVDAIAAVCGDAWIVALEYLLFHLWHFAIHYPMQFVLVFAPPVILSGVLLTILLVIGLLGGSYFDAKREWLARLGGWFIFYSIAWMVVTGIALFSSAGVLRLLPYARTIKTSAVLAWLTTTVGGIFAAKSSKSAGATDAKQAPKSPFSEALAAVAPYVFIVGLLILISLAAERISRPLCGWQVPLVILAAAAVSIGLALRVDINEFSMHAFYRNRLARCYLGASNAARTPDPFTGFDEHDAAIPVSKLRSAHNYHGPFPIFCTALNLTFGQDLAFQERKAASFAFTPLYSGYDVSWTASRSDQTRLRFNGFVKTDAYAYPRPGIHLSTVAAISGAAMSPNQGYHSSPAIAFLLTVFNVRLGWWLANPRKLTESGRLIRQDRDLFDDSPAGPSKFPAPAPAISLFYLASELLGQADDTRRYVYLSDGGHFDNMGLYELVRRRCRFIVISDAEQDGDLKFEGIGMAIRKCRIDFGAEIALDVRSLQPAKDAPVSQAHCVTGTIRYPEDPNDTPSGIVVYIKSSLTGDEPADVVNYKNTDPAFPHDSTGNQWFSESMFESYRRLGHHVAVSCFSPAVPSAFPCSTDKGRKGFFSNMRRIWTPFTPEMNKFSADHSSRYAALLEKIRTDTCLPGFFDQLFERDEEARVKLAAKLTGDNLEYATRFSSSIIEFIFIVYQQLRLTYPENCDHPFAQGWLGIFRDWYKVGVIQKAWTRFFPTYTEGFQIFFYRQIADPKFHSAKQP